MNRKVSRLHIFLKCKVRIIDLLVFFGKYFFITIKMSLSTQWKQCNFFSIKIYSVFRLFIQSIIMIKKHLLSNRLFKKFTAHSTCFYCNGRALHYTVVLLSNRHLIQHLLKFPLLLYF